MTPALKTFLKSQPVQFKTLRALVSQARPTFILTMPDDDGNQDDKRSNVRGFSKPKIRKRYEFFAINLMLTCLSNDMSL